MILDVFDSNYLRIDTIASYGMAQYVDSLNSFGSWSISIKLDKRALNILKNGKYILFDAGVMGEILSVKFDRSDGNRVFTLSGEMIKRIAGFRVIPRSVYYSSGAVTSIITSMFNSLFHPGVDTYGRKISFLKLTTNSAYLPALATTTLTLSAGQFSDVVSSILDTYEAGYDIVPVLGDTKDASGTITSNILNFEYRIIKGVDRTVGNSSGNSPVEFSLDLGNLLESEYTYSKAAYKNIAYVAGAEEGTIPTRWVESTTDDPNILDGTLGSPTGINRQEYYVDARDLQMYDESSGTTVDAVTYLELLRARGVEKLYESCRVKESYESTIDTTQSRFVYGVDFYKGDKVTVYDKDLDLTISAVVTAATVTSIGKRNIVDITFGYPTIRGKRIF